MKMVTKMKTNSNFLLYNILMLLKKLKKQKNKKTCMV